MCAAARFHFVETLFAQSVSLHREMGAELFREVLKPAAA
jgi:hypothetical protein